MADFLIPKIRIRGDVLIIFWPAGLTSLLPVYDAVFDQLDRDPLRQEPVRNYLLLVKDSTGDYNGFLPESLRLGGNVRQPYAISWFNEEDEEIACWKVKQAYDLGFGTNPKP